jgi:GPI mannosyltransferase 3
MSKSRVLLTLNVILFFGLLVRVWLTLSHPNVYHPDEIFQALEPAHKLVFGYGIKTWEWRYGVRSWTIPFALSLLMRASNLLKVQYFTPIALVLSCLSFAPVVLAFTWISKRYDSGLGLAAAFLFAFWFPLVYFAPKALSEVVAGNFLCLAFITLDNHAACVPRFGEIWKYILLGITASLRIQLGIAVFALLVISLARSSARSRRRYILVFCLTIYTFGLIDLFTLGTPFQSEYKYVWMNLVEGRSNLYGSAPWYWYLQQLSIWFSALLPFSLIGLYRNKVLLIVVSAIVLPHLFVAHKEIRFLYPAFPFILIAAVDGTIYISRGLLKGLSNTTNGANAIVITAIMGCVCLSAEWGRSNRFLYTENQTLYAFRRLSRDPGMCGVAVFDINWFYTGGYTYLMRPVPMYFGNFPSDFVSLDAMANRTIIDTRTAHLTPEWRKEECWGNVCVYQRPGGCIKGGFNDLNAMLLEWDQ